MKLYFRKEKRGRNSVRLDIVLGDCHPLLPHVRVSKVVFKDNKIDFIGFAAAPNIPEIRLIFQDDLASEEAEALTSYLQSNYLDWLTKMGAMDILSETTTLKATKKEK